MAYITIATETDEGTWTLKERLTPEDMRSGFFCNHLLERVRWAVGDVESRAPQAAAPADGSPAVQSIHAAPELS